MRCLLRWGFCCDHNYIPGDGTGGMIRTSWCIYFTERIKRESLSYVNNPTGSWLWLMSLFFIFPSLTYYSLILQWPLLLPGVLTSPPCFFFSNLKLFLLLPVVSAGHKFCLLYHYHDSLLFFQREKSLLFSQRALHVLLFFTLFVDFYLKCLFLLLPVPAECKWDFKRNKGSFHMMQIQLTMNARRCLHLSLWQSFT